MYCHAVAMNQDFGSPSCYLPRFYSFALLYSSSSSSEPFTLNIICKVSRNNQSQIIEFTVDPIACRDWFVTALTYTQFFNAFPNLSFFPEI
jgi:hypothetical protein